MTSEPHTSTAEDRLKRLHERLGGIAYGGDYNPEQWPREVWQDDVRLMKEAGVNLVTLAVFSWSRLETADGVYDFGWLDEVMELMRANGIGVDLATPDAVPPAWLIAQHPDILPVLADGTTFGFGSRQHFDVSHPAYREKSMAMAEKMGERYAKHPALSMWHVNNEYGPVSYGPQPVLPASYLLSDQAAQRFEDYVSDGGTASASYWTEHLHTETAGVLASYSSGRLTGSPAVTRNTLGKGTAVYLSARVDSTFLEELLAVERGAAGIRAELDAPLGVQVRRRTGNGRSYLLVLNHNDAPVSVDVKAGGTDRLTGTPLQGTVELAANGVLILEETPTETVSAESVR